MIGKNKVSNQQIKDLLVTTVIGIGILSMPSQMAMLLDNDGWVAIIIGGLLIVPFILMINKIFEMFPGKNIFQIGREVLGNVIFIIFLILLIIYVVLVVSNTVRVFGEVIKAFLLETTPIEVIIITMLLSAAYLSRSGIEVLGRTATMVYPILIGLIIFIVAVGIPDSDFTNIFPIFNSDFRKLPKALMTALYSYAGYEIIVLAYPVSESKKDNLKYALRGIFIVIGIYVVTFIVTLSQFGIGQLKSEIWPTIAVANKIDLPGYFLENLDGIVLALWVIVVYATIGPLLYSGGRYLASLFKTKSHDLFILPLIPVIYTVSLLPDNIVEVYDALSNIFSYIAISSIIVIPAVIFIVALIKKRKGRVKE